MPCKSGDHVGPVILHRKDGLRVRKQCETCLRAIGPALRWFTLPEALRRIIRPWLRPKAKPQPGRRKKDQAAYYRSAEFRALSKQRLQLDGYVCQFCGETANQTAHLSAKKLWGSTIEDVRSSCGPCNMSERERRITRAVLGDSRH